METITASPLCWPPGWRRTPPSDRDRGNFGKRNSKGWGNRPLTVAEGTRRVLAEIDRFTKVGRRYRADPDDVIISTNLQLRNDGLPRSNQREPDDQGVAVYFTLDGAQRCIPCDKYQSIAQNLAAIAATIESLRTLDRHGSGIMERAFTGFTPLPSPDQVMGRTWRDVLDYYGSSLAEAKQAFRKACSRTHPDNGGNAYAFDAVQKAWQQAQQELG